MARDLGALLHIPGVLAIPTMAVATLSREWFVLPGLVVLAMLSLGGGQVLHHFAQEAPERFATLPLLVSAAAWLLIALLGALPFYGAALLGEDLSPSTRTFRDPLNAAFESMSGFTSTGLTVAEDPSTLPMTLQWWRSLSQWVGAIGVVVLALMIIHPKESSYRLYEAEARTDQIGDDPKSTVRRIWEIYLLYTGVTIAAYVLAGMPWWEAINHGLTAISTGGFTTRPESFQAYDSLIKIITVVAIIVGAVNFQVHHALLRHRDWRFAARQSQIRALAILLVVGTGLLTLINREFEPGTALVDSVFQWTTALATCGLETVVLVEWSQPALWLLTGAMLVGGTAGSTVGGLKIVRLVWLVKALGWQLHQTWVQEDPDPRYTFNGRPIERDEAVESIRSVGVLVFLWMLTLSLGAFILLLLMAHERELHEVLFEATSALSNVGLSVGLTDPDLHPVGRLTLMLLMWMGRLEILGVLILLGLPFGLRLRRIDQEEGRGREE